jgi:hypothetical protein
MGRRRLPYLCQLEFQLMPYRPRHAAPPRLLRPLLRSWLAQLLLPPAPIRTRMTAAHWFGQDSYFMLGYWQSSRLPNLTRSA